MGPILEESRESFAPVVQERAQGSAELVEKAFTLKCTTTLYQVAY